MKLPKLLGEVIKTAVKKPVTKQYPLEPAEVAPSFRGRIYIDPEKCMGCGMCARDCPTGALEMVFYPNVKRRLPKYYIGLCIFCYQCVDSCMWNAIKTTTEFELATYNKNELLNVFKEEEVKPLKRRPPERRPYFT